MTADGKALETRVCPVWAMWKPATPVTSSFRITQETSCLRSG